MDLTKELRIILANIGDLVEREDDRVIETHVRVLVDWIQKSDIVLVKVYSQVLYAS